MMWEIRVLLDSEENVKNQQEAERIIQQYQEGKIQLPRLSQREEAQLLVYDAYALTGREREVLAKKAIDLSEECADAYGILAKFARSKNEKLSYLDKGIELAEKQIHPIITKDPRAYWLDVHTRPYMRLLLHYGLVLKENGQLKKAMKTFHRLLEQNPDDHQGVRYVFIPLLLELGDLDEADYWITLFYDEQDAFIEYAMFFIDLLDAEMEDAEDLWYDAMQQNPFAAEYMMGEETLPLKVPEYYTSGSEDEGIFIAQVLKPLWEKNSEFQKSFNSVMV